MTAVAHGEKKLRIGLILPFWNPDEQWGKWKRGAGNNNFNLGMAYVAGVLRHHGFPVSVCDPQFFSSGLEDLREYLQKNRFDIIGIPCFTPTAYEVYEMASFCRLALPKLKIVLGGGHPTLYPGKILDECPAADFSVYHEGEGTMLELAELLEKDPHPSTEKLGAIKGLAWRNNKVVVVNEQRPFIADLDELPRPAYEMFPLRQYRIQPTAYKRLPTYTMLVSRGCPYHCTFCSGGKMLGKKMRYRSVPKVIEDMGYLIREHGARGFMFQDTSMPANRKWMVEFCEALRREHIDVSWMCYSRADHVDAELLKLMKSAGCFGISFGVETANQKSLDLIRKGLTVDKNIDSVRLALDLGFHVTATYILGLPGEDEADVLNTIRLARRLATHIAHFFLPLPYPETELFEQCRQDGGLREDYDWRDFSMTNWTRLVYVNPRLGSQRMLTLQRQAILSYYRSPRVIWRNLLSINSMDDVRKYFNAALALSGYLAPAKIRH
jgi:radical SAM superfamily enzyme YgiQ (UPF0313 family)